jgi:hypothetical protein
MEFRYGISPRSLARWLTFERISAIQAQLGRDVGRVAISRINAELDEIERATTECERGERVCHESGRFGVLSCKPLQT